MKASDIIKRCMGERDVSQMSLSNMLGESRQNLNYQLNVGQDMKFGRVVEVLDILGYEIRIVDKRK